MIGMAAEWRLEEMTATAARACVGGSLTRGIVLLCADGGAHELPLRRLPPFPYPPIEVGLNPPVPPVVMPLL